MNVFIRSCFALACLFSFQLISAQVTPQSPTGALTDGDCPDGVSRYFSFTELFDNSPGDGSAAATAEACNGTNCISAEIEYSGGEDGVDLVGTLFGNGIDDPGTGPDVFILSFGTDLTDPVVDINSIEGDGLVLIEDMSSGVPTTITTQIQYTGSLIPLGGGWTGSAPNTNRSGEVQIVGTFSSIQITVTTGPDADAYDIGIGTCISDIPVPPLPACAMCTGSDTYKFIKLTNKSGTGTGATADIELNDVLIGTATVLFSDLDINEDLSGTQFGGYDNDGGTYLLELEFCQPINVEELDIRNLEVESQVSVGTATTTMDASAVLSGLTLTQCAGSTRMGVGPAVNEVITDGPGCSANPNGTYTIGGAAVSTIYFKYHNPPGGCTGDYVGFRIGTCVPDLAPAIPACPLTLVTVTTDMADVLLNGVTPGNTDTYILDGNGNYFNEDMCSDFDPLPMVAQPTIALSPCATVVDEVECSQCTPTPPCVACPMGSEYEYISLDKTGTDPMSGLDVGLIEIDGVCIGDYEFLFSDLDVNTDGNGTTFGGFDNDGGTMLLQLNFCDPLAVQQLDVRNLEVMSQVSVGTTISGVGAAAVLGGQVLTFCNGSSRMDADDITNGNLITTAGPGCGANPNASYTLGTSTVNTLYFKYHNPPGGCSFDYVGFKIGTCVTPPPMAAPVCPLEIVRVTCDMDDVIANGANAGNSDEYVIDGNGNYFDFQSCSATILTDAVAMGTPLQTVNVGCAELVETVEECVVADCIITPQCMASTCPANTTFEYISLDRTNANPALPIGIVNLNNVQVGTYEFLFGDLDNSLDGNGTTFGGWDTDGGTLLLKLDFCTPLTITELDIRNLEVGSQVSVGTAASTTDASAVLSGQTLTFCNGSDRMTLNDGATNLVITDGPGCGANPNATYTVGTNPVSTFYFKYHNPPSDGTFPSKCRGDYVGFRIAACTPEPQTTIPECSLQLFNVTDANGSQMLVRDKNGKYFNYSGACPSAFPTVALEETIISPCATVVFVEECSVCVIPGLAKTVASCVQASSGIAGNADVTFKFTLANFGAADMINLQINDNINAIGGFVKVVSPPVVTMTSAGGTAPTPNAAYAGAGNLLNGTSGALNDGEQVMVEVVVEIDPTNTGSSETNTATGGGTPPAGSPVFLDDSDNGTVPHPQDDPTDIDDPTPLQFPKINMSKQIVDVRPAGAPDRFFVDFMLHVKNTGNVTLSNVVVEDDLATQLGASFIGVTVPPVEDPGYNGSTDIDIPVGTLARNATVWISFTIEIMTPVSGSNQASVSGEGPGPGGMTVPVMDLSDAGANPEGNNPGAPGGGPGSSDATFFGPGATPNGPQSLSCPSRINVTLDANCKATLPANFGGHTPNGALIAIEIYVDGVYVGNMMDDSMVGKDIVYRFIDLSTGQMCWGKINLEDKNIPLVKTSRVEVMCSAPVPSLVKLSDVIKSVNGACGVPVTNISEYFSVEGEACTGFVTIRKITGLVYIDGQKSSIDLRIDTIVETPLDTSMITCPLGGPGQQDGLKIPCEAIGDAYPTPDVVAGYYKDLFKKQGFVDKAATNLATTRAYPYILKGIGTTTLVDDITPVITSTLVPTKILVTDDDGNQYWVFEDVIVKDTTYDTTFITQTYPIALPLPKGVTCNLSAKCTDMQFAGCAGDSSKIMRTWQILDWCNGSIKECMQWIIVEPEAPFFTKVQGKKVTKNKDGSIDFYKMWPGGNIPVDIAPWTCAAELSLSAMVDFSCASGVDITWSSTIGTIGNDNVLRGLWYGEQAHVTATAITDCGSHGEYVKFQFWVTPRNYINPVAIAEDEVNVSLVGDPTGTVSDNGIAKVFVNAIDAGSHNAGCGPVETCLLLKEELENPILIDDKPVYVNGHQIYHAAGCGYDGILKGVAATKLTAGRPDYPYSICKDFVKFCCTDLGPNLVALVVTNDSGHASHSWSTVNVEDKSSSSYLCHPGAVISCDKGYDPYDYAPYFESRVCTGSEVEYTIAGDADACGNGQDVITWTLDGKVICTTKITFSGTSAFNPYEIKWPKHYTGEKVDGLIRECELWLELDAKGNAVPVLDKDGNEQYRIVEYEGYVYMGAAFDCAEGDDTGQPVWCEAACALVGSSFEPLEVEAADACKKIIRRWTVIDWCTWDPNTANPDDDNDTAYDQFQAIDDEWLDAYDSAHAGQWWTDYREAYANPPINVPDGGAVTKLECDWCDKQNAKAGPVYFRYTQVDKDGYYTFDQVIKVIDETDPTVEAPDKVIVSITAGADAKGDDFEDCKADEDVTANVSDMCGDTDLSADGAAWWIEVYESDADSKRGKLLKTKTAFGTSATMNSQVGTQGDYHLIVWQVRDGCANTGESETLIKFQDDKQPTPICIQDLSTAIMPSSGTVEIWATDYDNGSFDNCSEVTFWFLLDSLGYPTDDQETGTFSPNLQVTCEMLVDLGGNETIILGLYVRDAEGNTDFCNISLDVNGATDVCELNGSGARIEGEVATAFGDMVEGTEVALSVGAKDLTSVDGKYAFMHNAMNISYDIRARKSGSYLNGVSALDLVLIQQHILGIRALDSPYKVIAADINNDDKVSATDMVDLRRLILGLTTDLPKNSSWRFVSASQQFDDVLSPFPFMETINIPSLDYTMSDQNFIGVKIGDVSGNAIANSTFAENRNTNGTITFEADDNQIDAGSIVEVNVRADGFTDLIAYQFTLELDGLEFVASNSGALEMNEQNFGIIDANRITTTWISSNGVSTKDDLFTMTFKAKRSVLLSEAISISSNITRAVAYTSDLQMLDVGISFNAIGSVGFALNQNTPNPFREFTKIGFELPGAGNATITISDVTGKVVSVLSNTYSSGTHELTINKSELGGSGVLYYQLEYVSDTDGGSQFSKVKRMILIE